MLKNILFKSNKISKEKNIECIGKYKFENAMSWAKEIVENEDKDNIVILLDYILETVKNDLKYSLLTEIIYSPRFDVLDITRKTFIPQFYKDENGDEFSVSYKSDKTVNLKSDTIISVPYRRERKRNSIINLKNNKFEYIESNHMGKYYEIVDITYIYNGIHSISSGVELCKDGNIEVKEIVRVGELFPHIYTDGVNWINTYNDEIIYEVVDFRIAILFEVARLKFNIYK